MTLAILLGSSLGLLVLPAGLGRVGRRMAPQEWARLVIWSLATGAVALELALILVGLPTVARSVGVPQLASACERMAGGLAPGGPVVGWFAAGSATLVLGFAARAALRARRSRRGLRIESTLGEHRDHNSYELVVLPTERVIAVSVPGNPGQIVVSDGLVRSLSPEAFEVVLRHEEAHLAWRHGRYLVAASMVESSLGIVPLVRRSAAILRLAVERWADEDAAMSVGSRTQVHEALIGVGNAMIGPVDLAAFSAEATLSQRLDALACAPRVPTRFTRSMVYAVTFGLGLGGAVGLGTWFGQAHMMLSMAGLCRF